MRDLEFPDDARKTVDSLQNGLRFDASFSLLGIHAKDAPLPDKTPDFSVFIRASGRDDDEAVRREAVGLIARAALVSMVGRLDQSLSNLLLQRRVLERLGSSGSKMDPASMWQILKQVSKESRNGPRKMCDTYVVKNPSKELQARLDWLDGIVKVRNCLAHRNGLVAIDDVKPSGVPLDDTTDSDRLTAVWLRAKATCEGQEIDASNSYVASGKRLSIEFETQSKEWAIGEWIHITPEDCQAISMTLATLGNHLLHDFEREIRILLKA